MRRPSPEQQRRADARDRKPMKAPSARPRARRRPVCGSAQPESERRGRGRARELPDEPESTSPAPAVASLGTAVSTTRSGSSGVAISVSGPLQQHRAAPPRRPAPRWARRAPTTSRCSTPEQPRELARVWRQHRRAALAPATVRSRPRIATGHRHRAGARLDARTSGSTRRRVGIAAEARPSTTAPAGRREREQPSGSRAPCTISSGPPPEAACPLMATNTQNDAAARAEPSRAESSGAPLVPGEPPTSPATRVVLGADGGCAGSERRSPGRRAAPGRCRLERAGSPIGTSRPRPRGPGRLDRGSELAAVERDGAGRPDRRSRDAPVFASTPLGLSSSTTGAACWPMRPISTTATSRRPLNRCRRARRR